MLCSMCPFSADCEDSAQLGGGCDCDGADDFGVDPLDDSEDCSTAATNLILSIL